MAVFCWRARKTLTWRAGPMGVGAAAVRCGALVPQGGVALTTVGRREGDGTSKLAVGTGRRAEGT